MSVRLALLAILDQGPCYGYQLRTEFDRRTGSTWPLNVGQVYNTLDRLERDGLARKGASNEQGQQLWEITERGREEAQGWLATPLGNRTTARNELAMKLALAVTLPGAEPGRLLETQRSAVRTALQQLAEAKADSDPPASASELARSLVVDSLVFELEGELRWLDHAEGELARAAAAGAATPLPLTTEAPKRGRPSKNR